MPIFYGVADTFAPDLLWEKSKLTPRLTLAPSCFAEVNGSGVARHGSLGGVEKALI